MNALRLPRSAEPNPVRLTPFVVLMALSLAMLVSEVRRVRPSPPTQQPVATAARSDGVATEALPASTPPSRAAPAATIDAELARAAPPQERRGTFHRPLDVTAVTDRGRYRVVITADPGVPELGEVTFVVDASRSDASDGATITVRGRARASGHASLGEPISQSWGDGVYHVSGGMYDESGWWDMTATIRRGDDIDEVSFSMDVAD